MSRIIVLFDDDIKHEFEIKRRDLEKTLRKLDVDQKKMDLELFVTTKHPVLTIADFSGNQVMLEMEGLTLKIDVLCPRVRSI